MKKVIRVISLIFALIFSISCFTACGDDENVESKEEWQGRGVHTATVTDIDGYFMKNGQTEYTLVVPKDAKKYELEAANVINKYTKEATGETYPVATDDQIDGKGKYISLGETTLLHESGLSIPIDKFGDSGFRVYTKGDTLFLAGARSLLRKATYYAALEFLKYTVDFKAYALDEVKFTASSIIKAKSFDVVEIPEFDYRRIGREISKNEEYSNLLRNDIRHEGEIPYDGHSHFRVLDPKIYFKDHPDWYWYKYEGNTVCEDWDDMWVYGQLCLSNPEMIDAFVAELVTQFRAYPEADFVHLGMMDSQTVCQCKNCNAARAKYNTNNAGLNVIFTNEVARRVTAEIQKTEPMRDLYFQTFAYLTIIDPPASYDEESDTWTPHCDEVIPDKNVVIQYAPLTGNTTEAIDHKANESFFRALKGWAYLCSINNSQINTWLYGINFSWQFINHKSWDTFVKNMRIYSDYGVTMTYNEAQNAPMLGEFMALKTYVESELLWNLSLNYNDLVKDFIINYYGPAAPYVQQIYDQLSVHYEKLTEEGYSGIHNMNIGDNGEGRWTFAFVESQRILFDKAFKALETLKTEDPDAYAKYYKRVLCQYAENIFMQMEFFMPNYSSEHITESINLFETAAQMHGVVWFGRYAGGRQVSEFLVKWRGANV